MRPLRMLRFFPRHSGIVSTGSRGGSPPGDHRDGPLASCSVNVPAFLEKKRAKVEVAFFSRGPVGLGKKVKALAWVLDFLP
jgi:hypothetical protein